jgi:hypothetical protein
LRAQGLIAADSQAAIQRLWHFGQLIANTDMHDGNLSLRPGLQQLVLAPVYDMLPMMYAPLRGVELPPRSFAPPLPLPSERDAWRVAATAAVHFWSRASDDARISKAFRQVCAQNAQTVRDLSISPLVTNPG